ncbi:MAG: IS1 family transposase, partial [Okeania sp. SIO3B3]|nr:IS1 family transposase [Okeania sp. SIO3B3]
MKCPKCHQERIIKNGSIHNGKHTCAGTPCGRSAGGSTSAKIVGGNLSKIQSIGSSQTKLKRPSTNCCLRKSRWLALHVSPVSRKVGSKPMLTSSTSKPHVKLKSALKKKGRLTLECDELWSFVGCKRNKQWIWVALDANTREVVALHIGDRSQTSAQHLWYALPPVYRQCALCYTDFWEAYKAIFPAQRHRAVGKETGLTAHIERFNNT